MGRPRYLVVDFNSPEAMEVSDIGRVQLLSLPYRPTTICHIGPRLPSAFECDCNEYSIGQGTC